MSRIALLAALAFLVSIPSLCPADDWPQWLGPQRDGVWREQGLLPELPKEGLKVRWRAPVGMGYAGPAVAGGKVFLLDRQLTNGTKNPANPFDRIKGIPGNERVLCLDEATGKTVWTYEYDCPYTVSYAGGPRCTPAVVGDRVYTFGTEGHFHCLDATSGKVVWGRKLAEVPTPMWGYAGHPLVDGDLVYVPTADPKGILYALNRKTGEIAWQAIPAKECGYSPPVIFEIGGKRQLIQWHPAGMTSLDPVTGKILWNIPQEPMKYGVTIVTPRLYHNAQMGDLIFVSSQYGGALMVKVSKDDAGNPAAATLWHRIGKSDRTSDAIQTLMATPLLRDDHLYGIDAKGQLRGLQIATGDRIWETFAATTYEAGMQSWATTFIVPLGDTGTRCLLPNEHGDLILADLTPAGYKELGKIHLLDPTNNDARRPVLWCHPAFANKSIYWRNDNELVCWSYAK